MYLAAFYLTKRSTFGRDILEIFSYSISLRLESAGKYLSVTTSQDLQWTNHIYIKIEKAIRTF